MPECRGKLNGERFTCAEHGGTFNPPNWRECSNNPNPFVQASKAAEEAFRQQLQLLEADVAKFQGWSLCGFSNLEWSARGPGKQRLSAPTHHGLLERIRQATGLAKAPQQEVLL